PPPTPSPFPYPTLFRSSYFLTFPGGGRLELMHRPDIQRISDSQSSRDFIGYAHLGVEVGSRAAVDALTKRLQGDGFPLLDGPRQDRKSTRLNSSHECIS